MRFDNYKCDQAKQSECVGVKIASKSVDAHLQTPQKTYFGFVPLCKIKDALSKSILKRITQVSHQSGRKNSKVKKSKHRYDW